MPAAFAERTPIGHSVRAVSQQPVRADVPASSFHAPDEAQLCAWMKAYQAGRLDGFDRFHAAVAPALRRYLLMLARDRAIADDLLQETFLQVHRSRHTYDTDQPLRPWVFAIARHVFLMHNRATRRRLARIKPLDDDMDMPVSAEVEGLADRLRVRAALAQLGQERREALLLHHVWGFSFREVGAVLAITEAAAKLRSSRGMIELRSLLQAADTRS